MKATTITILILQMRKKRGTERFLNLPQVTEHTAEWQNTTVPGAVATPMQYLW